MFALARIFTSPGGFLKTGANSSRSFQSVNITQLPYHSTKLLTNVQTNVLSAEFATKKSVAPAKKKTTTPKKKTTTKKGLATKKRATSAMKKAPTKRKITKRAASSKRPARKTKSQTKTLALRKKAVMKNAMQKRKVNRERLREMLLRRKEKQSALNTAKRERLRNLAARRKEKDRELRARASARSRVLRLNAKKKEQIEVNKERKVLDKKIRHAKPKRSSGPFALFLKSKFSEVKKNNPSKKNAEIFKEVGQMWRNASTEEKKKFSEVATEQSAKYRKATVQFRNEFPKKSNPFNFFMKDNYKGVKENRPDARLGEISQEVSQLWRNASSDVKEKYQRMSQNTQNKRHNFMERLKASK